MSPVTSEELAEIIAAHREWLISSGTNGKRADFTKRDLTGLKLDSADLTNALFYRATLVRTSMIDAVVRRADFDSADLSEVAARGADFSGASLDGANCRQGNFELANFSSANLHDADLSEACCRWCVLRDADLRKAKLVTTELQGANLAGANLIWTSDPPPSRLQKLRDIFGFTQAPFRLDANYCAGTRFPRNSTDEWSVLRRAYTGSRYLVLVILTLIAFLPWSLKIVAWAGIHKVEMRVFGALERGLLDRESHANTEVGRLVHAEIDRRLQSYREKWHHPERQWSVISLLVGAHISAWTVAINVFLLAYYSVRGFLTLRIASLRDEEERTGVSPSRSDYSGLSRIRFYLNWMTPVAIGITIYRITDELFSIVVLPL